MTVLLTTTATTSRIVLECHYHITSRIACGCHNIKISCKISCYIQLVELPQTTTFHNFRKLRPVMYSFMTKISWHIAYWYSVVVVMTGTNVIDDDKCCFFWIQNSRYVWIIVAADMGREYNAWCKALVSSNV